jgi:nucleotide-binding universal stress UspA family protein
MIRTIFVPTSGSFTDEPVFATALAAARALAAHVDFYHVRVSADQAAHAPRVDLCVGAALPVALQVLGENTEHLSEVARAHVTAFCDRHAMAVREMPERMPSVSASFLEEQDHARDRMVFHARHSDLVVMGRPSHIDYMPSCLIEDILMECGRPILIAPDYSPKTLTGTVVVGWKEAPNCARALSAAYPLLAQAGKVILLNLAERGAGIPASLEHLAQRLKWHGMSVETQNVASSAHSLTYEVSRAADELHADLLVVGGFGHRRLRETLLGGVTQSLLKHAGLPVFMMH